MADLGSILGSAGIGGAIGKAAGWTTRARGHGPIYVTREPSSKRLSQPEWAIASRPPLSQQRDAGGRSRRR
jgi:hypothetical protein